MCGVDSELPSSDFESDLKDCAFLVPWNDAGPFHAFGFGFGKHAHWMSRTVDMVVQTTFRKIPGEPADEGCVLAGSSFAQQDDIGIRPGKDIRCSGFPARDIGRGTPEVELEDL